jgi:hypothetical protein
MNIKKPFLQYLLFAFVMVSFQVKGQEKIYQEIKDPETFEPKLENLKEYLALVKVHKSKIFSLNKPLEIFNGIFVTSFSHDGIVIKEGKEEFKIPFKFLVQMEKKLTSDLDLQDAINSLIEIQRYGLLEKQKCLLEANVEFSWGENLRIETKKVSDDLIGFKFPESIHGEKINDQTPPTFENYLKLFNLVDQEILTPKGFFDFFAEKGKILIEVPVLVGPKFYFDEFSQRHWLEGYQSLVVAKRAAEYYLKDRPSKVIKLFLPREFFPQASKTLKFYKNHWAQTSFSAPSLIIPDFLKLKEKNWIPFDSQESAQLGLYGVKLIFTQHNPMMGQALEEFNKYTKNFPDQIDLGLKKDTPMAIANVFGQVLQGVSYFDEIKKRFVVRASMVEFLNYVQNLRK